MLSQAHPESGERRAVCVRAAAAAAAGDFRRALAVTENSELWSDSRKHKVLCLSLGSWPVCGAFLGVQLYLPCLSGFLGCWVTVAASRRRARAASLTLPSAAPARRLEEDAVVAHYRLPRRRLPRRHLPSRLRLVVPDAHAVALPQHSARCNGARLPLLATRGQEVRQRALRQPQQFPQAPQPNTAANRGKYSGRAVHVAGAAPEGQLVATPEPEGVLTSRLPCARVPVQTYCVPYEPTWRRAARLQVSRMVRWGHVCWRHAPDVPSNLALQAGRCRRTSTA